MLDALGVDSRGLFADAEHFQKILDSLMPLPAFLGQFLTGFGQEDSAIGFAGNQPTFGQSGQHFGHGRLGDAEPLGDIHLPGFLTFSDQIGDQFDIVLHQRAALRLARLPEPFGMGVGIRQGAGTGL